MKKLIQKIRCLFERHDDLLIHDNKKHTIKQCRCCGKYEVNVKDLDIIYRCRWELLPMSYKY